MNTIDTLTEIKNTEENINPESKKTDVFSSTIGYRLYDYNEFQNEKLNSLTKIRFTELEKVNNLNLDIEKNLDIDKELKLDIDNAVLYDIDAFVPTHEHIDDDAYIHRDDKYDKNNMLRHTKESYNGGYTYQEKFFDEKGCVNIDIHEQDDTITVNVYENEQLSFEATYKVDWNNRNRIIRHGYFNRYKNGMLVFTCGYFSGKRVGTTKRWNDNGELIYKYVETKEEWDDKYWSNRDIINNDIKDIYQDPDNPNGEIIKIISYDRNNNKIIKFKNVNDLTIIEEHYHVNTKVRIYLYQLSEYDSDNFTITYRDETTGNITYHGSFKYININGKQKKCKHGLHLQWYLDGSKKFEGEYYYGKKVNWMHYWDENNKLIARKRY